MSSQTHHIKSLLFELEVEQEPQARQHQADMSQVWRAQIMPLLERCLNESSEGDSRLRIDSLELDLGTIEADRLTEEVLTRLEQRLRRALAKHGDTNSNSVASDKTDVQANLELLAVYARNGCLTWRADRSQGDPVSNSLDYLLQQAPAELARMMHEIAKDQRSVTRIVNHCDDRILSRLSAITDASQVVAVECLHRELLRIMHNSTLHAYFPARVRERRKLVWAAILRAANQTATHSKNMESFLRNVLLHMAMALQSRYDKLVTVLHTSLEKNSSIAVSDKLRQLVGKLNQEIADTSLAATGGSGEFTNRAENDTRHNHTVSESGKRWAMVLRMLERLESAADEDGSQTVDALHGLIDTLIRERCSPPAGFAEHLREFSSLIQKLFDAGKKRELNTLIQQRPLKKDARLLESAFNEAELRTSLEKSSSIAVSEKLRQLADKLNQEIADTSLAGTVGSGEFTNRAENDTRPSHSISESGNRWATVLQLLEGLESAAEEEDSQAVNALRDLIDTLIRDNRPPPAGFSKRLRQFDSLLPKLFDAGKRRQFETLIQERPLKKEARPLESVFNEPEEAYVENAGLVLLWPFLQRFFSQLELLEDKQFKDAEAAQRAVGLLQYLATEDASGPEYLLPLNKVLCGMKPEDEFDFGSPLSETERDECMRLLEAVIEHASVLRNMSIEGLRGTFLLRKGILDSRDGAWLLRVERESYDVVLDRFPWAFNWVKLAWMTAPMCVEW